MALHHPWKDLKASQGAQSPCKILVENHLSRHYGEQGCWIGSPWVVCSPWGIKLWPQVSCLPAIPHIVLATISAVVSRFPFHLQLLHPASTPESRTMRCAAWGTEGQSEVARCGDRTSMVQQWWGRGEYPCGGGTWGEHLHSTAPGGCSPQGLRNWTALMWRVLETFLYQPHQIGSLEVIVRERWECFLSSVIVSSLPSWRIQKMECQML